MEYCADTIVEPVRQAINIPCLEQYLNHAVPEIQGPLDVKQFGFGQSNPTYLLTGPDGRRYVLRKKPPGPLLSKTAHQIEREYNIISALRNSPVPVPRMYCLCEDSSVIGTPFYVMEFLDGRIFTDSSLSELSARERNDIWREAVSTLAQIHHLDPQSVGLQSLSKPGGYYNRQISIFKRVLDSQSQVLDVETKEPVGTFPYLDEIIEFFSDKTRQPRDRATLVHGDYKMDNLIFHRTETRIIGVIDWEMATIGHPLSDFCNLTHPYFWGGLGQNIDSFKFRRLDGLPTREQCESWYTHISGWNPRLDLPWGDAFFMFRTTVIMHSVKARLARRQTGSSQAGHHASKVNFCALQTRERIRQVEKIQEEAQVKSKL